MSRFYYTGYDPDSPWPDEDGRQPLSAECQFCGEREEACGHCQQCGAQMALGYRCDCDQDTQDADQQKAA